MRTVTLDTDIVNRQEIYPHKVYARSAWGDPWVEQVGVFCTSANWAAHPTIPQATLHYRFGYGRLPGTTGDLQIINPYTLPALAYVKIEFDVRDGNKLVWAGLAGNIFENRTGSQPVPDQNIPTGTQTISCMGFEFLLTERFIDRAIVLRSANNAFKINRAVDFNKNGRPNMTAANQTFELLTTKTFSFELPEEPNGNTVYWNSRDAVKYLLAVHSPRDQSDDIVIQFELPFGSTVIPDNDKIQLTTEQQTASTLIGQLISRQRGLGFHYEYDETSNKVFLKPFTFSDVAINLGDGVTLPANPDTVTLESLKDHSGSIFGNQNAITKFDQVRVVGAPVQYCFTIQIDLEGATSSYAAWDISRNTEYQDAASLDAGYPDTIDGQQRADMQFRQRPEFQDFYRRFTIPDDWDRLTYDGRVAVPQPSDGEEPPYLFDEVFPSSNTIDVVHKPNVRFLDVLPMAIDGDYTAQTTTTATEPSELRRPFMIVKNTDDGNLMDSREVSKFANTDFLAPGNFSDWAAVIRPDKSTPTFEIVVAGAEQYVLDSQNFEYTPADEQFGEWQLKNAFITVAITADEICQVVVQTEPPAPVPDLTREKRIDVGPDFQLNIIAANTVIGVDPSDSKVPLKTGNVAFYTRDDRPEMRTIARRALEWYGVDRTPFELSTNQVSNELPIGAFIKTIVDASGNRDVNTVITSASIDLQLATSPAGVTPPTMYYQTEYAELDVV